MHAEEMWKSATGKGVKVAVIDSGVNSSTPSLKGQVLQGLDATGTGGKATDDYSGHGTTMAELIAGTGAGGGLRGLAADAKIVPMRVVLKGFTHKGKVNAWSTEEAIRAAADSEAQIINMSFGGDFASRKEQEAVKYAQSKGKLLFAGVGNDALKDNKAGYPAAYPQVVGVASADRKGRVADYSEHGKFVDIASPGNDIPRWCDANFQSYCDGDGGTSAATAIASASAALIWSAHPDWTANQVLRVLFDTAGRDWKKGTVSNYLGHGLIRPGQVILDGKGDPGAPGVNPLANKKASGSPAPSASAAPQTPQRRPGDKAVVAGSSEKAEGGSRLVLILGVTAAVSVLAAGLFAVTRRRRSG
ncbi:S8 family serine peptidase [Streptomyces sp. 21So2-11]|uniref:S8 family serine peptidase n=1 Tax=Streptomyces sp. 21So2-11 TaxID=3144408 RepID=UPI0032195357